MLMMIKLIVQLPIELHNQRLLQGIECANLKLNCETG